MKETATNNEQARPASRQTTSPAIFKKELREIGKGVGTRRCRFVNDVLQRGKRRKDEFGRAPVEGAHGEIVVFSIPDSKLFLEVLEGKEFV